MFTKITKGRINNLPLVLPYDILTIKTPKQRIISVINEELRRKPLKKGRL